MKIHPSAIVHSKAQLAADVEVQAFTIIDEGVEIGAGTVVGPHCVLSGRTTIGRNNHIFSNAQVGVLPQDLKHVPGALGRTIIGDNNVIRETVTISSGTVYSADDEETAAHKVTRIGNGCLLMACSHVAHDCRLGDGVILANHVALAGHVTVQDKVIIGGLTGIHQFVVLGAMSFIGAMSRISKDVLPFMIVEGHTPPKCFGPNRIGLERNGFDSDRIAHIKAIYKLLYRSDFNTRQALERIAQEIPASEDRDRIVAFIQDSKRGVT